MPLLSSATSRSLFPLTVNELGEVRIAVHPDDADEARRIIDSHRTELTTGQVVRLRDEFEALQRGIDYRFRDRGLLEHAMTHTSRANEDVSGGVVDNESLEFLGDAVLGFVIADMLFREFPAFNEGQKSKIKASLVSTATLARQAERLALGDHLLLGRGEEKTGGRRKQALLADGYEALIAAIYLDGGIEQARAFIAREFAPLHRRRARRADSSAQDLQVGAAGAPAVATSEPLPEYRLAGTIGPDHRKQFQVAVFVGGEALAEASGPSKKEAEQEAARLALEKLRIVTTLRIAEFTTRTRILKSRSPAHQFRQSISMMPHALRSSSLAHGARCRHDQRRLGRLRQARQRVAVHFAREFVFGRRDGAAVQAHPDAQQRVGVAVALLPRRDQVDVLEPRQVVLGRARRALQPLRNLGQRQPFLLRQDLQDRLERAVAARAMQAQLVAEVAVRARGGRRVPSARPAR